MPSNSFADPIATRRISSPAGSAAQPTQPTRTTAPRETPHAAVAGPPAARRLAAAGVTLSDYLTRTVSMLGVLALVGIVGAITTERRCVADPSVSVSAPSGAPGSRTNAVPAPR